MAYGKKESRDSKTTRIEYRAGRTDADLLKKLSTITGLDKSAIIRLAVRRLAIILEKQGWPIHFLNKKGKDGGAGT